MKRYLLWFYFLLISSYVSQANCRILQIECNEKVFISGLMATFYLSIDRLEKDETVIYNVNGEILKSNIYESTNSGMGVKNIFAFAEIKKNNVIVERVKQSFSYLVTLPNASIFGPNSNILYDGIEQFVYVSIPGVSPNNTILDVEGAKLTSVSIGKYTVKPDSGVRVASILVSCKMADGVVRKMAAQSFRVIQLPAAKTMYPGSNPVKYFSDSLYIYTEGGLSHLELKYKVKSFKICIVHSGKTYTFNCPNNHLNSEIKSLVQSLKKSDLIIVYDIVSILKGYGETASEGFHLFIN